MSRRDRIWTLEYTVAQYVAVARRVGGTPRCADLGSSIQGALTMLGLTLPMAARYCGLTPNRIRGPRAPLPDGWAGTLAQGQTPAPAPEPPTRFRDPVVEREYAASRQRRSGDWRRTGWRLLGAGPRCEISQPGPHIDYAAPDDLTHSQRRVR